MQSGMELPTQWRDMLHEIRQGEACLSQVLNSGISGIIWPKYQIRTRAHGDGLKRASCLRVHPQATPETSARSSG